MNIIWSKVCIISQSVGRRNYRGAAAGAVPVQFLISSAAWEHVNRPRRVCSLHPAALQSGIIQRAAAGQGHRKLDIWMVTEEAAPVSPAPAALQESFKRRLTKILQSWRSPLLAIESAD